MPRNHSFGSSVGLSKHWEECLETEAPEALCPRGLLSGLAPGVLAHDLLKASTLSAKRGEKLSFRSAYM